MKNTSGKPVYSVAPCTKKPLLEPTEAALSNGWENAVCGKISRYYPQSKIQPKDCSFWVMYDDEALYLRFSVYDEFICASHAQPQELVCEDNCCEFFVQPRPDSGYFNFEVNAAGVIHFSYIRDCTRFPDRPGFADWTLPPPSQARLFGVRHSLPLLGEKERIGPERWCVTYRVPFHYFESFLSVPCRPQKGDQWRANFYHCAEKSSHPRWGYWSKPGTARNYHQPEGFGILSFD